MPARPDDVICAELPLPHSGAPSADCASSGPASLSRAGEPVTNEMEDDIAVADPVNDNMDAIRSAESDNLDGLGPAMVVLSDSE
eukprot:3375609-Amphidinium_carterae.1